MSKKEVLVFEVSQQSFDASVIQNSFKLPVLVEFMGVWSEPCIKMADELSSLATEFAGQFIFAKVDTDEQPELTEQYEVKNVPTLKVFVDGEVIFTEEGQFKEEEIRVLLKGLGVFSEANETRQKARQKHMEGDTLGAIQLLTQAIQRDPSDVNVAMDMTQIFIDLGEVEQAKSLYNQLPDSAKSSDMGKSLLGQLTFLDLAASTQGKPQLQQQLLTAPTDCDAHFDLAICLIAERDYKQAVDHLIKIIEMDENDKDDAAKEMIVNVSNMLAPNNPELAGTFRRRLGTAIDL